MSKLFEIAIGENFYSDHNLDDFSPRDIPLPQGIRRGDIVHLTEIGNYKDEGKLIYDGEKLIALEYNDDEYGYLPREFTINEFGPHYFRDTITCNSRIWANFDNYAINGDNIKAASGDTVYTIVLCDDFTMRDILLIMARGKFDYTDDPTVLEYW